MSVLDANNLPNMQLSKITLFHILLLTSILACLEQPKKYTTLQGNAQGTTFRIVFQDTNNRDFSADVDSIFRAIDHSMSLWDSTSIITKINNGDTTILLDEPFKRVFTSSQQISEKTDGAFDITVAPLVKAWGFSFKKGLPAPTEAEVQKLSQLIGFQQVKLIGNKLSKTKPELSVDFNAIAQGYSVDAIAEFLMANKVVNYLVEIGGEVRANGVNDRKKIWKVGIDKPIENGERQLQAVVELNGRSLATSGSYRKFIERDGKKYSHTIDPKTGYPVTHNLLSASVVAANCTNADAYATACMVVGVEKSLELARKEGFEVYLIFENKEGKLSVRKTAGFKVLDVQ